MRIRHIRQSGQTAILFTLGLTTMFGMVGLVSDVGYVYYRKQAAQAAAQAAASAAVKAAYNSSGGNFTCGQNNVQCHSGYPPTYTCPTSVSGSGANNLEVGCLYAMANGYSGSQVAFQSGTGNVEGIYTTYWVIARVSEHLPLLFSSVIGSTATNLTARSVAGYIVKSSGGCIYVLDQTANASSLITDGNGFIQTGCGIWDNTPSATAVNLNGANTYICVGTWNDSTSTCTASTTSTTEINGSGGQGWNCGGSSANCIQPTPSVTGESSGDPLAGLPAPSYNPNNCTSSPSLNGNQSYEQPNPTGTIVFCNANVKVQGGTLTLDAGTYVFTGCSGGQGLSASGQGNITGHNVTLYFTGDCAPSFTGNGSVSLIAPTSGTYNGILMFQDSSDTTTAYLTGGATQILQGVAYFPGALLHYTGGTSSANGCGSPNCSQALSIVAKDLEIKGDSYIQSAGSSPYLTSYSGVAIIE
ncbi:MAG TPA: pilus assembly protein TadG-related protein [Bryobacteraceae bacterium]|nr:pilus assembly protein TadG-related protein [Bryobacteraceae bacterium]